MKTLAELLTTDNIHLNLSVKCKKEAFLILSEDAEKKIGSDSIKATNIFKSLMNRENIGSTKISTNVAIPHAKIDIDRIYCSFYSFEKPFEYETHDDTGVDILVLLLAPEKCNNDHVKILSKITRIMKNKDFMTKIKKAKNAKQIKQITEDIESIPA